jgi:hypothetical protein
MLGVREGDELVTAAHLEVQNSLLLTAHHHKSGSTRQTVLLRVNLKYTSEYQKGLINLQPKSPHTTYTVAKG